MAPWKGSVVIAAAGHVETLWQINPSLTLPPCVDQVLHVCEQPVVGKVTPSKVECRQRKAVEGVPVLGCERSRYGIGERIVGGQTQDEVGERVCVS